MIIDLGTKEVRLGEKSILLSPLEFDLLVLLAINDGEPITPETLFTSVWQFDFYDNSSQHTLRTTVNRLRRKLGETAKNPIWIGSRRGRGYWLLRPVKVLEAPSFRVIAQELPDGTLQKVRPSA